MKVILFVVVWIAAMVCSFEGISTNLSGNKQKSSLNIAYCIQKDNYFYLDSLPLKNNSSKAIASLEEKWYVVIGVFALESNAIKFAQYAKNKGFPANFLINPTNNFYYVYLHDATQPEEAKEEREAVIARTNIFTGIWILNNKTRKPQEEQIQQIQVAGATTKDSLAASTAADSDLKPTEQITTATENEEYLIYPNAVYIHNYKEIKANVQVIDPVRAKLMKTIAAHELSSISDPNNGSHTIQLIADAFGYRKVQHDLLLTALASDSVSSFVFHRGDTILVEFPMERLKAGDIVVMFNVFFKNNASIMESVSKYELASLLEMLNENPDYRITIHGHTNGNKGGPIIKLAKENPDFFTITEENKTGYGSAKQLSKERALTIKRYLAANGIAEDRMEVKGWGGKRMIYDSNSLDAKKNVRVEIEILED